ncbi:MAG: hypothetical protein WDW36_002699 [Sanguina aurantia]
MSIGTTRNLTSQFVRLRNEAKKSRPATSSSAENQASAQTARLLGAALGSSSSDIEMGASTTISPSWVLKSERVRAEMGVVKDRLVKLREYHSKALLVSFDTDNDSAANVTEALTREIQSSFKKLDAEIRDIVKAKGVNEDEAVRGQVQRQLAQALFKLSVEFRKEETRFLNRVEAQKGLTQGSSIGVVEGAEGRNDEFTDPGFTQAQLGMVDFQLDLVQQRDEEIRTIVETIAELAQIMRDLSTLVVDQGTILDRIDYNLVQTLEKTEQGVKELKVAEKTQKSSRMFLCIIILVVMITIMLIIVIVRHSSSS